MDDCKKCACPTEAHSFSKSCYPVNYGEGYVCDQCQLGHTGLYCEKCDADKKVVIDGSKNFLTYFQLYIWVLRRPSVKARSLQALRLQSIWIFVDYMRHQERHVFLSPRRHRSRLFRMSTKARTDWSGLQM